MKKDPEKGGKKVEKKEGPKREPNTLSLLFYLLLASPNIAMDNLLPLSWIQTMKPKREAQDKGCLTKAAPYSQLPGAS